MGKSNYETPYLSNRSSHAQPSKLLRNKWPKMLHKNLTSNFTNCISEREMLIGKICNAEK